MRPAPGISCENLVPLQLLSAKSLVRGHKVSAVEERERRTKGYSKQERVAVDKLIPCQEMEVQCIQRTSFLLCSCYLNVQFPHVQQKII